MKLVNMKCPNCGGEMRMENNQFVCDFCGSMLFNLIDVSIDEGIEIISPEELENIIENSKKQLIINTNGNLTLFDVDAMVTNKKIKDATELLSKGEFSKVIDTLKDLPDNILSVERLRFLARFEVQNEYELSFYDGYIDNNRYGHFENLIRLSNKQTKETYLKLADHCRTQYDKNVKIKEEITAVDKLLNVKLYDEAITYAQVMCKKYPHTVLSWWYMYKVKSQTDDKYDGDYEFSMMAKCPDRSKQYYVKLLLIVKEKVDRLIKSNLPKEAINCAEILCKNFPKFLANWCFLYDLKRKIDNKYVGDYEYSMMTRCPDYSEEKLPKELRDFIKIIKEDNIETEKYNRSLKKRHISAWIALLSGLLISLLFAILEYEFDDDGVGYVFFVIIFFLAWILSLTVGRSDFFNVKEEYINMIRLSPQELRKQYFNVETPKKYFLLSVIEMVFLFIIMAIPVIWIFI